MMLLTWVGRSEKSMKTLRVLSGSSVRELLEETAVAFQASWWDTRDKPEGRFHTEATVSGGASSMQLFNKASFHSYCIRVMYCMTWCTGKCTWVGVTGITFRWTTQETSITQWGSPFIHLQSGIMEIFPSKAYGNVSSKMSYVKTKFQRAT